MCGVLGTEVLLGASPGIGGVVDRYREAGILPVSFRGKWSGVITWMVRSPQ